MTTKEIPSEEYYAELIKHASSVLKLSQEQIREKYADYPICLIEYIEKEDHENSIEIRFDKEKITLTCTFNNYKSCDSVFLFPDSDQLIEGFVSYLIENYNFNFLKNRFSLPNCYAKVKELKELPHNICLVFF